MKEETQKPVEPSEMEKIRLKSVDPVFLKECKDIVKRIRQENREADYAELLAERERTMMEEREKTQPGFEKYCREYKPEADDGE